MAVIYSVLLIGQPRFIIISAMERFTFAPNRRLGIIFHLGAMVILLVGAGYGLNLASQASIGPVFLIHILPALLAVFLVPLLAYRLYGLSSAVYILHRDGIRLQWGFRIEDIPMTSILWTHRVRELRTRLPLPIFFWPGSVLGVRNIPGTGTVEFLASTTFDLVLIATNGRLFAISPADNQEFLDQFRSLSELGSLTPLPARSIQPSLLVGRVWGSRPARYMILAGLLFSLILFAWVSVAIPAIQEVSLGFRADLTPRDPIPTVQLLLLPILNSLFYIVNLLLGLAFFRSNESHPMAFLLWTNGMVIPILFLLALFAILYSG
jgi:hypothetical protein